MSTDTGRCGLAHDDDPRPCEGPQDAVRLVDGTGTAATGCVMHAASAYASITDARVYPGSVPGAAIDTYQRAMSERGQS